MNYTEWVESLRGRAKIVTEWDELKPEPVTDAQVSSHAGTVRKSFVGDNVVLARITLRANSVGKPHRHTAEQTALILRGAVRVTIGGEQHIARAGSILHIPGDVMHLVEVLDEEAELVDIFSMRNGAAELEKRYE